MKHYSRRFPFVLGLSILFLSIGASAHATFTGYIKIGDIRGGSSAPGHEEEIDILSISWAIERSVPEDGSRRGSGLPTFTDLTIVKHVDRATAKLFEASALGRVIPECILFLERPDSTGQVIPFLEITLNDVLVTSVSLEGDATDDPLLENVSLNFTRVEMLYFVPGENAGIVQMDYDLSPDTTP